MNDDTTVNVKINATDTSKDVTEKASSGFKGLWASVAGGQLVAQGVMDAWNKLEGSFKESLKSFETVQNLQNQINLELKDTKDVSGQTSQSIENYALKLSNTTPISKEAALQADQVLLKYNQIGSKTFPQAQSAVADLAEVMSHGGTVSAETMSTAAQKLGVALTDPEKGMGRLKMAGIALSATQQQQIKDTEKLHGVQAAQVVLLNDISSAIGGSAVNASHTLSGEIEIMRQRWQNLQEELIGKVIDSLTKLNNWIWKNHDAIMKVVDQVINFLKPSFEAIWHTLEDRVLPTMLRLWHEVLEPLLPIIGGALVVAIKLVVDYLNAWWTILTTVINWMLDHKQVVIDFATAFGILALAMKFDDIKNSFIGNMTTIMQSIGNVKGKVIDLFTQISGGTVMGGITVTAALADIALVMQAIQDVLGAIGAVNNAAKSAADETKAMTDAQNTIQAQYKAGKITKAKYVQLMQNITPGAVVGKASGGPVQAGTPYIVGEAGPEVFVPAIAGNIVPNHQVTNNNSSSNQNVSIGQVVLGSAGAVQEFFKAINQDSLNAGRGLAPVQGAY